MNELRARHAAGERDFRGADLFGANLFGANLRGADLRGANLVGAYLCDADLRGANLRGANLRRAYLRRAYLRDADLRDADLRDTCLDPLAPPNGNCDAFTDLEPGWKVGYRTKNSPYMDGPQYIVGELREAPVFSTAPTDCHPGIFVCPTIDAVHQWLHSQKFMACPVVSVIFRPWECHRAGDKYRVRWCIVWEDHHAEETDSD